MAAVRCPRCGTRNDTPSGTSLVTCANCGAHFRVVDEEPLGQSGSSGPGVFDSLAQSLRGRGMVIGGSIGLLLLFVGFWALLHYSVRDTSAVSPTQTAPPSTVVTVPHPGDDGGAGASAVTTPAASNPSTTTPAPVGTSPPVVIVPAAPVRPAPAPLKKPKVLTDEEIGQAITRGVDYLISNFDPTTNTIKSTAEYPNGINSLCVYALAQASTTLSEPRINPGSPFMKKVLSALRRTPDDPVQVTYGRSLRASALSLLNRPEDRNAFDLDVNWLLRASRDGAYTYGMPKPPPAGFNWDNSNSQYGLYGVWAGAEAGLPISQTYWESVDRHWVSCQNADGSFSYSPGKATTLSMTVAGIASLFVAHDYLASGPSRAGIDPLPAIKKALDYLEHGDRAVTFDLDDPITGGYTLYGVARAGLASGYKYFGAHNWFEEMAPRVIATQKKDGSFNGRVIDTSFAILFLVRGRHPVIMNKLFADNQIFTHPRDVSNLARFASRQLERTFNAQVISLTREWSTWTDAPIIYLPGFSPPEISEETCDQLRKYIRAGGLLVTHSDSGSMSYSQFAAKLADRLFPEYAFGDIPQDHPLYNALYKLNFRPTLQGVSNGARLLMIHSPTDLAADWSIHDFTTVEPTYKFGLNLYVYAAGRSEFRNRLDNSYLPAPDAPPTWTVPVGRLRYAGPWDPEPYAWTRFSHVMQLSTGYAINPMPINLRDLTPNATPIAHLTGTEDHPFAARELDNLRKYVEAGGVLLIDDCGGGEGFRKSQIQLLTAFPGVTPTVLKPSHPLLTASSACMEALPVARPRSTGTVLTHPSIFAFGKGHVIFTPDDITCGLLDSGTIGITGYRTGYAIAFTKNLVLWTLEGQKDQ